MNKKALSYPYLVWSLIFVLIPTLLIVCFSLFEQTPDGIKFSIEAYARFFDPLYSGVMMRSISMAFQATVICLVLAYPLAMILNSNEISNKSIILILVVLPMWMNSLMRTYAWMILLENTGILNNILAFFGLPTRQFLYGREAIVFGMVYNFFPFMVLPIYNSLAKIDHSIVEASYDLGANKIKTFTRVILPLSMPGVVTGIIMVFMPSLTTFVITRLLGGGQVVLIGNIIEEQFTRTNDWAFGSALSVILMLIILVTIWLMGKNEDLGKGGGII